MILQRELCQLLNILGSKTVPTSPDPDRPGTSTAPLLDRATNQRIGRITITNLAPSGNTVFESTFSQNTTLCRRLLNIK